MASRQRHREHGDVAGAGPRPPVSQRGRAGLGLQRAGGREQAPETAARIRQAYSGGRPMLQLHVDQEGEEAAATLDRVVALASVNNDSSTLGDIYNDMRHKVTSVMFPTLVPVRFEDSAGETYELAVPRARAEATFQQVDQQLRRINGQYGPEAAWGVQRPGPPTQEEREAARSQERPPLPEGTTFGPGMSWHQMAHFDSHYTLNREQRRQLARHMRHFLTVQANGLVYRIRQAREQIEEGGFAGPNVESELSDIRRLVGDVRAQLPETETISMLRTFRRQLNLWEERLNRATGRQEREESFRARARPILQPLEHAKSKIREASALYGSSLGAQGLTGYTPNDGFDRLEEAERDVRRAKDLLLHDSTMYAYRSDAGISDAVRDVRQESGGLAVISSGRVHEKSTQIRDFCRGFFHND